MTKVLEPEKHSTQMRAVLHILKADQNLCDRVLPFIDLGRETIYWNEIFKIGFESGHRAALIWCYSLWMDEPKPRSNCFNAALNMESNLQIAVLEGLGMRWGLQTKT